MTTSELQGPPVRSGSEWAPVYVLDDPRVPCTRKRAHRAVQVQPPFVGGSTRPDVEDGCHTTKTPSTTCTKISVFPVTTYICHVERCFRTGWSVRRSSSCCAGGNTTGVGGGPFRILITLLHRGFRPTTFFPLGGLAVPPGTAERDTRHEVLSYAQTGH